MVITYYCIVTLFIIAYLLGSIPSAVWIGKRYYGVDVREHGSKNAGTTNVLRVLGTRAAIPIFAIDFLKGFIAVSIFSLLKYDSGIPSQAWIVNMKILAVFVSVLGHIFPIFANFRGGKGVATSVGIFAVCCPIAIILGLCVFAVSLVLSRIVSVSSLLATLVVVIIPLLLLLRLYLDYRRNKRLY